MIDTLFMLYKIICGQMLWCVSVIPALGKLMQQDPSLRLARAIELDSYLHFL
jgi:hypothetical protein